MEIMMTVVNNKCCHAFCFVDGCLKSFVQSSVSPADNAHMQSKTLNLQLYLLLVDTALLLDVLYGLGDLASEWSQLMTLILPVCSP